jgi:hypothetical protein
MNAYISFDWSSGAIAGRFFAEIDEFLYKLKKEKRKVNIEV